VLKEYAGTSGGANVWGYVTPHATYQGVWSYGTFRNGTTCVAFGQQCPNWPGFALTADGATQGTDAPTYTVWWGDLIRGSSGTAGLQYLRNRYYDPKTGRFTQPDPIGLAGGLNLYGFAAGDPVNHADPFGLCDNPGEPKCKGALQKVGQFFRNFASGWN
jgi:RHS repeat-associated protein